MGGGDKDEDDPLEEKNWEKRKISYYHPDKGERVYAEALFVDGELSTVSLDADKITFQNQHIAFAGLFTEREGGTMVVDEKGNRVPGTEMTRDNVYYAQAKGLPISVNAVIVGTLPSPLPATINYGDPFPEVLPIPKLDEGEKFLGWYEQITGYITGPDGVVYEQYRTMSSHHRINVQYENWNMTGGISRRYIMLTPHFSQSVNSYYDVTFAFNDGTYRESKIKAVHGTPFAELEMPTGAGDMREIVGWSLDPNVYVRPVGELIGNVTLYAVWKNYRYACVIAGLGEERVEKVYEGESFSLGTPAPREGYTFGGWYDNELYIGSAVADTVTYGGVRECYYARWIKDEGGGG